MAEKYVLCSESFSKDPEATLFSKVGAVSLDFSSTSFSRLKLVAGQVGSFC